MAISTLKTGATAEPVVLQGHQTSPRLGPPFTVEAVHEAAPGTAAPAGPSPIAVAALVKYPVRMAISPAAAASATVEMPLSPTQDAHAGAPDKLAPVQTAAQAIAKDVLTTASPALAQPEPSRMVAAPSEARGTQPVPRTPDAVSAPKMVATAPVPMNAAPAAAPMPGHGPMETAAQVPGPKPGSAVPVAPPQTVTQNGISPVQNGEPQANAAQADRHLALPQQAGPRDVAPLVAADQMPSHPASTPTTHQAPADAAEASAARLPPMTKPAPPFAAEQPVSAPVEHAASRRPAAAVSAAPADNARPLSANPAAAAHAGHGSTATTTQHEADETQSGDDTTGNTLATTTTTAAPASSAADATTHGANSQPATPPHAPGPDRHAAATDGSDVAQASPPGPDPSPDAPPPPEAVGPSATPSPSTAPAQPANPATVTATSQVAHAVAGVHVAAGGQGQITIHLQPGDLGAVQVKIERAADGTATVTVQVEKADTLQTMQQDISHLHQALDRAGVPSEFRQVTLHLATPATASSFGTGPESGSGFQRGGQSQPQSSQSQSQSQPQSQSQSQSQAQQHQGRTMAAAAQESDTHDDAGAPSWMPVGINITA